MKGAYPETITPEVVIGVNDNMHVHWNEGRVMPLLPLRREAEALPLSPERKWHTTQDLLTDRYVLIFSERSGGGKSFLQWWLQHLTATERPWLYLDGHGMQGSIFQLSNQATAESYERTGAEGTAAARAATPKGFMEAFSRADGPAGKAGILIDWARARNREEPFFLVLRNLGWAGQTAEEVAGAFRLLGDEKDPAVREAFHILIASTSESSFEDKVEFSGFGAITTQYRLPYLNAEEIATLAQAVVSEAFEELGDQHPIWTYLGRKLEDEVGGQVELVQSALRELSRPEIADSLRTLIQKHSGDENLLQARLSPKLNKVVASFRNSPPTAVRFWQEDLKELLSQEKTRRLVEVLRQRVEGARLPKGDEPPAQEKALLIGGWCSFDRFATWGMTSPFHAHFARQVLDNV